MHFNSPSWTKPKMTYIRDEFLSKPWFRFDLDDTLHESRKAFGVTTSATLSHVATKRQIQLEHVKAAWKHVLARETWNSFTDGRTQRNIERNNSPSCLTCSLSFTRLSFGYAGSIVKDCARALAEAEPRGLKPTDVYERKREEGCSDYRGPTRRAAVDVREIGFDRTLLQATDSE
jgi:hypothetical protein